MRLPWPFGRRTSLDGPASSATEAGGGDAGPVAPIPAPGAVTPTGAWSRLPPIQRTVGPSPLVAPSEPFLDDVPGHRPLPPILAPLGHDAGPSGPPGLVVAHARPVPSLTSHAPLPTRTVQRRAAPADDADRADTVEPAALEVPAPARPDPQGPSDAAAPAPIRRVATVAPSATVTPPARPLTRTVSLAPVGRPIVSRSPAHGTVPSPLASTGVPAGPASATSGAAAAAGLTGPLAPARSRSHWAERPAARATATVPATLPAGAVIPASQPADRDLSLAPRRGAAEVPDVRDAPSSSPAGGGTQRRAGLGAPIAIPPASAVVQRLPMRSPARSAGPAHDAGAHDAWEPASAVAIPAPPGPAAAPSSTSPASAVRADRVEAPRLPTLPVFRRHAIGDGQRPTAPTPADGTGTAPSTAYPSTTVRPTMGLRPLRPSVAIQREPGVEGGSSGAGTGEAETPVVARWGHHDELPDVVVGALPAAPVVAPAPAFSVQRSSGAIAAAPGGGLDGLPHEIVFPPRDAGPGGPPSPGAGTGPDVPQWSNAVGGAPASVAGPRTAVSPPADRPLTLARPVAGSPSAAAASVGGGGGTAPVVARIVADPVRPSAAPTVQTSMGGGTGGTPVAAITATPVVQRVDGAAPPPAQTGGAHSDTELDDLARALFGRIRTHLRAEVIHEREAKGLTFDAF